MQNVTVRLPVRLLAELEREADEHGVSRSEYIRDTLATRHEHTANTERIAELERENDRLQNHLQTLIADREDKQELVEYVETERELERARVEAPVWRRAKWWVFGRD